MRRYILKCPRMRNTFRAEGAGGTLQPGQSGPPSPASCTILSEGKCGVSSATTSNTETDGDPETTEQAQKNFPSSAEPSAGEGCPASPGAPPRVPHHCHSPRPPLCEAPGRLLGESEGNRGAGASVIHSAYVLDIFLLLFKTV